MFIFGVFQFKLITKHHRPNNLDLLINASVLSTPCYLLVF